MYANTYQTHLNKLITLNNKIIRILFNKPCTTHVNELYSLCNTLPVNKLHKIALLKLVHKIVYNKNKIPEVFENYFQFTCSTTNYSFRYKYNLNICHCNTTLGQRCFIYKGAKLWNDLPETVKSVIDEKKFRTRIVNVFKM